MNKTYAARNFTIFFIGVLLTNAAFSQENPSSRFNTQRHKEDVYQVLNDGLSIGGEIDLEKADFKTFSFYVPSDALGFRINVKDAPVDLDIYVKQGSSISSYDNVDYLSSKAEYNEELQVIKYTKPEMKSGIYYVDIAYQLQEAPIIKGERTRKIPFTIQYSVINQRVDEKLVPGQGIGSYLRPETGMFRTFTIKVPEYENSLRIDLYDVTHDLDLFIRHNNNMSALDQADFVGEDLLSRESITLTREGNYPLKSGIYYITVLDQIASGEPEPFSIIANYSKEPPDFLKKIPDMPKTENPIERALYATVELINGPGSGSGCIVSPKGHILTNWHVVMGAIHKKNEVIVAFNMDYRFPPKELFRASIVKTNEKLDLALLKIKTGMYGQKLPPGYTFPFHELGTSENISIGDQLYFVGYPTVGGSGSRASVTYTQGILSGYDRTYYGTYIKTDGEIHNGNSGGAALNDQYKLIGLPTSTVTEKSAKLGYIYPIDLVPESWLTIIEGQ